MNFRSTLIVSIFLFGVLLQVCPSHSCFKKVRTLIRNKGKEEKPAELARDEASFIKYSHATSNNFYIEILQNPNKTFVVRELDHPIIMNQVKQEGEPDAEYINKNGPTTAVPATTEIIPPQRTSSAEVNTTGEGGAEGELGEEEEEILSPEDENVRREWGGSCVTVDWEKCNKIRQIVVLDVINNQFQRKNLELDCLLEPILCLKNGWTANRCHILCMAAQCNKRLFFEWDDTVDFEGPCRYRK